MFKRLDCLPAHFSLQISVLDLVWKTATFFFFPPILRKLKDKLSLAELFVFETEHSQGGGL